MFYIGMISEVREFTNSMRLFIKFEYVYISEY